MSDDLERAKREVAASKLQSQQEWAESRQRARKSNSLADLLRELREANGFSELLDEAFGGGRA